MISITARRSGSVAKKRFRQPSKRSPASSDILIGNEEDFQLCLDIEGPEAGGKDIGAKIDGFKEMIGRVKREYSGATLFATTLREVETANMHHWGAIVSHGDEFVVVKPRAIGVYDRIGGGDGFVGGLLYGVLQGWDAEKSTQFGWATGALAATMWTDYGQPPTKIRFGVFGKATPAFSGNRLVRPARSHYLMLIAHRDSSVLADRTKPTRIDRSLGV